MEDKTLKDNIEKYKLSEDEHKKVFEQLKEKLFVNKS